MAETIDYQFFTDKNVQVGRDKPECPGCANSTDDKIQLIDVVIPTDGTGSSGGTIPVWRCQSCSAVFAGRTSDMRWMFDRQHQFEYTSVVNNDNFIQELKTRFNELISDYNVRGELERFIDSYTPVKNRITREEIDGISIEIGQLKEEKIERAKDPMSDLRYRVANFKLTE